MFSKISSSIQIQLSTKKADIIYNAIAPDNKGGPRITMQIDDQDLVIQITEISTISSFLVTINDLLDAIESSEKTVTFIREHKNEKSNYN
ncbi:MAG: KEOPS complex subunit Pcc1 [Candidatus Hodarchaeota archaeon]